MARKLESIVAEHAGQVGHSGHGELTVTNTGETAADSDASGSVDFSHSGSTSIAVAGRRHVTVLHITANVRGIDSDRSEYDPEDQMEALFIQAIAQFYHGDFRESLESCRQGWELFDPQRCLFHTSRTGQHAGVAHLSYMALSHWYLGQPASALERMQEAYELANGLDHPFTVAFVLHHYAWLNGAMRSGVEAETCASQQIEVAQQQAFFFWETTGMLHGVGGLIWLDRVEEARDRLLQGLARYHATGAELALPQYQSHLAASHLKLGSLDAAGESLDQAFAAVAKSAEHFHEPELWRLRGQLAAAKGDRGEAIQHVGKAIEVARRHDSAAWELTALLDLADLTDSAPDRDAITQQVADVLARFESCEEEIAIVAAARALLA